MIRISHIARAAALLFLLAVVPAAADSNVPRPQGPVILTITGAVANAEDGAGASFDAASFAALPRHRITTATPWYDAPRTFEGPLLRDLLAAVGARGRTLRIEALNDYAATLPISDALRYDVIVADRIDGAPIPVRERGPFFIIYPFDQEPALKIEQYYQRSVWQVRSIDVRP